MASHLYIDSNPRGIIYCFGRIPRLEWSKYPYTVFKGWKQDGKDYLLENKDKELIILTDNPQASGVVALNKRFGGVIKSYSDFMNPSVKKSVVVPQDGWELRDIIKEAIAKGGLNCDLNFIDTSLVTNMRELFSRAGDFSKFNGDISKWNTSNVTDMSNMFVGSKFNGDISKWDTSKVKTMGSMFASAEFNGDISSWNVSSVRSMEYMFAYSKFNGDISRWNTSEVRIFTSMFRESKFNGDISSWNVTNARDMDEMFMDSEFKGDISKWYLENLSERCAHKMLTHSPIEKDYVIVKDYVQIEDSHFLKKENAIQETQEDIIVEDWFKRFCKEYYGTIEREPYYILTVEIESPSFIKVLPKYRGSVENRLVLEHRLGGTEKILMKYVLDETMIAGESGPYEPDMVRRREIDIHKGNRMLTYREFEEKVITFTKESHKDLAVYS